MEGKRLSGTPQLMYGTQQGKACRLHDLFYNTKTGSLVHRMDAAISIGTPFCGQCEQYASSAREKPTMCMYCGKCPYCKAGLVVAPCKEEGKCKLQCRHCGYDTAGHVEITLDDPTDPIAAEQLMVQSSKKHATSQASTFTALTTHLSTTVAACLSEQQEKPLPTERAMGLNREKLRVFEACLEARQTRPQPLPFQAPVDEEQHSFEQPAECPLMVRTAVRYQKYLLSAEIDNDGNRRLNRSAVLLFPKILITPSYPREVSPGTELVLPLTFVNPSSFPCCIVSLNVTTHHCTVTLPEAPLTIGPLPETLTHTPLWAESAEAKSWDNNLIVPLVVRAESLPAEHEEGEGLELCLEIVYKHSVDSTETETPMHVFVVLPFE